MQGKRLVSRHKRQFWLHVSTVVCIVLSSTVALWSRPLSAATPGGHDPAAAIYPHSLPLGPIDAETGIASTELPDLPPQDEDPAYTRGTSHHQHGEDDEHEFRLSPFTIPGYAIQPQAELQAPDPSGYRLHLPLLSQPVTSDRAGQVTIQQVTKRIDMKLLVIAADGNETDYPAAIAFLQQVGIPFDVILAAETPITWDMLSNGFDHGYYQGIILITGNLGFFNPATGGWESALDGNEWWALWTYESMFGVRQVTSYTYPTGWPETYGLIIDPDQEYVDTTTTPLVATLTDAGKDIYPYLNTATPITFMNAWVYLANVIDPAVTTPLLVTGEGHAIASIHNYGNGRENLTITAANNPYLIHSLLLSYGMINWVTKGLYLGEREVIINPQVDDLLIDSDMWDINAQSDTTGLLFRMTGRDFRRAIVWQNRMRTRYPLASSLILEWAFNGEGATGIYSRDSLTPAVIEDEAAFAYVNHTLTHANLDDITYDDALAELSLNHEIAINQLGLSRYVQGAMVQPDISGLYNPEFQRAAFDFGMEYFISDTSRPGWNNPTPNAGFYSEFQPSILIIPRRPTNLFYNLATPPEWVSEYNCFYGPTGTCADGQFRYWSRDLTYAEILDVESEMWLQYLLKWDIDPLMFHQANVRAYTSNNSLLGDLIEATLAKYSRVYNLPILGLTQQEIGVRMAERMRYNNSGARATLVPCESITLTVDNAATVPITGLTHGDAPRVYGGQTTSFVALEAGASLTIPAPACE
ncbi:MAG: hypothetical protein WDZ49_09265 [Litorilinea sp.]